MHITLIIVSLLVGSCSSLISCKKSCIECTSGGSNIDQISKSCSICQKCRDNRKAKVQVWQPNDESHMNLSDQDDNQYDRPRNVKSRFKPDMYAQPSYYNQQQNNGEQVQFENLYSTPGYNRQYDKQNYLHEQHAAGANDSPHVRFVDDVSPTTVSGLRQGAECPEPPPCPDYIYNTPAAYNYPPECPTPPPCPIATKPPKILSTCPPVTGCRPVCPPCTPQINCPPGCMPIGGDASKSALYFGIPTRLLKEKKK